MAKRVDHDSTMEMSTSQLVPDAPREDASVWKQVVVGTEQFAPTAAPTRGPRWGVVVAVLAVLAALGGAAIYYWL